MEGDEDPAPIRRSSRPAFADDVYGAKKEDGSGSVAGSGVVRIDAQRRSANLVKLKELKDGGSSTALPAPPQRVENEIKEEPELEFSYDDCDTYQNEIAELYAYAEMGEYANNVNAFKTLAEEKSIFTPFSSLSRGAQKAFIVDVVSRFESADAELRLRASRSLLYILQGAFLDFADEDEDAPKKAAGQGSRGTGYHEVDCFIASVNMAYLAFEAGAYHALTSLLHTEIDIPFDALDGLESGRESKASAHSNSRSASNMDLSENERRARRSATLVDNEALRVVLSCLYHMVEAIRRPELIERVAATHDRRAAMAATRLRFIAELEEPLEHVGSPLLMLLLDMCPPFYNGDAPHYPMRKVLVLIWKILLTLLGGWDKLRETKESKRAAEGLPDVEDTLQVASSLKASTVRDNEGTGAVRARPRAKLIMSRQLACTGEEGSDDGSESGFDSERGRLGSDDDSATLTPQGLVGGPPSWKSTSSSSLSSTSTRDEESGERTPTAESPGPLSKYLHSSLSKRNTAPHGPSWQPKTRLEDIDMFLQNARMKFFHYELPGNTDTLFGLPPPIHGSVAILRKHLYTSLMDLQIKRETQFNLYPFSCKETIEETRAEILYRSMLPNLSSYVVALLKVLLAAAPSNKAKNDALNILCDVLTPETESSDVLSNSISLDHSTNTPLEDSLTLTIDIYRHKEVMVKATSAILILLLKHFRLNHVYQFEFLAQHISLGNGVPLILKFLDQNMARYMQSRHELHPYNFPQAAIYFVRNNEWPVLNADNVEAVSAAHVEGAAYSLWRNVFSSINLLRILNKITKWKHSRTMLLVVFRSAPILKRCLKIKLAVFQVFVLKLLKMQSRYLGRQWRRCNMDVISSIYTKVRHRLGDDWAFANDTRTKSWHLRTAETDLRPAVEKFNARRYGRIYPAFALDRSNPETAQPSTNGGPSFEATTPALTEDEERLGPSVDKEKVDNSFQSALGRPFVLGDKLKKNYDKWMEMEVLRTSINWDLVLENSRGIIG